MATNNWGLLDEREEADLHKARLLNNETKPFQRLTKRLMAPATYTNPNPKKLTTPPSETENDTAEAKEPPSADQFREDVVLDFAAFDSSISRLQLLQRSNTAERERYAADRLAILQTMDEVRASNGELRTQLEGARDTLAQRRRFDELADKITANRMLRPRAEQGVNLTRLADECTELRRESAAYAATWQERRGQFERLVDEGKRLRALIRDEKEEVERREGMDSDAEDGGQQSDNKGSGGVTSNSASATPGATMTATGNATPRPEGAATPRPVSRGGEGATPRPDSPAPGGLRPGDSVSRGGSQVPSREGSQARQTGGMEEGEEGEDVNMGEPSQATSTQQQSRDADTPMAEGGEARGTPQITVDAAAGGAEDKMDTS